MNTFAVRLIEPLSDQMRSYFVKNRVNIYFHDTIMPDFCFIITDKTKDEIEDMLFISKVEAERTNGGIA